jgi:hypothetical protein
MLPAVIPVVSSLALVAPQAASLMVSSFATNVAVRATVERIAHRSNVDNAILQAIADRLKTSDTQLGLADTLQDLKNIIRSANVANIEGVDKWTIDALREMGEQISSIGAELSSALKVFDGGQFRGLTEVLNDKEFGLRDCTLEINVNPSDYLINGYAETWTMYS